MSFQVNEKVKFLGQIGEGIILEIVSDSTYKVQDELGFISMFDKKELVKIHNAKAKQAIEIDKILQEKEFLPKHLIKKKTTIVEDSNEIDLHIENLVDSTFGKSNFEIVQIQMRHFKQFYQKSRMQRKSKIIVIHGVGEGVLKEEVRLFLKSQEGVECFDANYLKYGKGATEIRLFYNF